MPTERIAVTPSVLEWARTSARLSEQAAAARLGVPENVLARWESGEVAPTIVQLRNCARVYGRPLAVLLLPEKPLDFDAMRDFRRASIASLGWSARLNAEFRRGLSQREVLLELAEISPESVPPRVELPRIQAGTPVESAGDGLRTFLDLPISDQFKFANPGAALSGWLAAFERQGIIVIQTRGVELEEMAGFSISEWPYPVVALNGSDWPRARIFTLMHELAHLSLNLGGLCDLHEVRSNRPQRDEGQVEHLCNEIAASVLLPAYVLLDQGAVANAHSDYGWTLDELGRLATTFKVSSEAILLRLIALDRASWRTYRLRKRELTKEYEAARKRQAEQYREKEGGPSYYVLKARNVGHGYAASVLDAYRNRRITSLDVADYLDIRFSQLAKFEAAVR